MWKLRPAAAVRPSVLTQMVQRYIAKFLALSHTSTSQDRPIMPKSFLSMEPGVSQGLPVTLLLICQRPQLA